MDSRRHRRSRPPSPPAPGGGGPAAVAVAEVERLLGYQFRDPRLLEEALTHRSVYPGGCGGPSYQRLEFFGDAALALAVTNHLFFAHPSLGPGRLTAIRAANVSTETLARAAVRRQLFPFLRHNSPDLAHTVAKFTDAVAKETEEGGVDFTYSGTVKAPKVLADIVESIAAAVYLDCGFNLDTLWTVLRKLLDPIIMPKTEQPVTALYKLCQKSGRSVEFRFSNEGSVNITNVFVDGQLLGAGASMQKARDALEKLWAAELEEMERRCGRSTIKNHWPKPIYNRHPDVKWAQRLDKVYITVELPDAKNVKVNLEPDGIFSFTATAGSEDDMYELKMHLHDKVNVEESKINTCVRNILCVVKKAEKVWWKKLLRGDDKTPHYLKVDWHKWIDDEDYNGGNDNLDLGGMNDGFDDSDDKVSCSISSRRHPEVKWAQRLDKEEEEDDDCYEIDPISFTRKLTFNDSDDLAVIADNGPVALRDFPHPRHLCGNYPFNRTPHESYCSKCFCYVCEVAAPCVQWNGTEGHCNISTRFT